AEFTAKQQELEASFKMAKTGEERQKIISRFFELNAEYLVSVARFAEENAKDAVADKARDELRTHLLQNLRSLAESDSPVIGKALSTLAEKAPKELRGPLHLALAQNLRTQYEQAHQKKDKDADKLLARTEAVLKQVTKDYPEMNKRAQDLQFALDKLTVGRTAMDIDG